MLITCPQCKTSYNLPARNITSAEKVRCLKCGYVWKIGSQDGSEDSQEEILDIDALLNLPDFDFDLSNISQAPQELEEDFEIPDFSFNAFNASSKEPETLPEFYQTWLRPLYFLLIFCTIASVGLFYFIPRHHSPVKLESFAYKIEEKDFKHTLNLNVIAFNSSQNKIVPETFKIEFFDDTDTLLLQMEEPSPVKALNAGETKQINFNLDRPPSQTFKAVVSLADFKTIKE